MSSNNSADFYQTNIEKMQLRYPSFKRDIIDKYSPSNELTVSETPEGLPAACIEGHWIHSSRYPRKEALKLVKSGIKKRTGVCLVYGFGLGYHIEAILEVFPELQILIAEPEPELFLRALQLRDFSTLIESSQTGFLLNTPPDVLTSILSRYKTANYQSLKLRSLYDRNSDYYQRLDNEFSTFIRKKETNLNTLNRFGKTWTRNLFRNIEVFRNAGDSGIWYGNFTFSPALVVAAGPSLDDVLPVLPELGRRCIIICVDTALRAVLSAGVSPDFIVVVDPQYLNSRHIDNIFLSEKLKGTVLISESSTHPAVFRNNRLPVFFFRSVFPLGKLIERHAGIVSELGAGGSVSTTAWDFARRLGCPQIYTTGLDLGFPEKRTHCRTSLASFYTQLKSTRKNPADSINFAGLMNADPYFLDNNSGGKTLTDNRLIIYKWWFEGQIKPGSAVEMFNLSADGIKIEGMNYSSVENLLKKSEIRAEINTVAANIREQSSSKYGNDSFKEITQLIATIIKECGRLESICGEALEILYPLKNASNKNELENGFSKLSTCDKKISDSPSKELTGFIIQPVLNEIIDEEKSMFENSEKLYKSILEACSYHRIHAERALLRIKD
ncbi:MAG: DUF115 domain-containing protein [Spirochaetales bacterium]|uniref:DUF115 domain-containing protein n=1 Tax=Candidatus Thalassospirochaeta sargassi TaxID=3119039 RepID=A0AAJ1IFY2_9SPIO|nr:DUF115 domain-containing protein [Spirochaetales bacterium]